MHLVANHVAGLVVSDSEPGKRTVGRLQKIVDAAFAGLGLHEPEPGVLRKVVSGHRKHVQKKKGQNRKSALGEDGTCSGGGLRNLNREFRAVGSGAERARQRVTGTLSARNLPT